LAVNLLAGSADSLGEAVEFKDPDFELVERMAAGDERAMTIFYERYKGLVGRLARNSGLGDADARELVQESFLRVWRSARSFKGLASARSWLCGIVRHLIADHIDSAVRGRTVFAVLPPAHPGEEEALQPASPDHGPEKLLELAQAKECIDRCLKKLSTLHREVIQLRIFGPELKEQDVARVLGIPLGTVKSRTSIGLRALAACVEECCEGRVAHA
jgi:RNA polymerase sigma-70 factor (ECF subfamily)